MIPRLLPVLRLSRSIGGAAYCGQVTEDDGQTWVFSGITPDEIVQQWEDRYADRPHTLTLTDEERDTLRQVVDMEAKVEAHTTVSPRRLAVLRGLAERLK